MRNLWERLKPEMKTAFIDYYTKYPNYFDEIKEKLENEKYCTMLPYWIYSDLRSLTRTAFGETDIIFHNYFLSE